MDRNRRNNFSNGEILALVEGIRENKEMLFGKFDSNITNATKECIWLQILTAVNAVGGEERTVPQLKRKYSDFKSVVKSKRAKELKYLKGTGKWNTFIYLQELNF